MCQMNERTGRMFVEFKPGTKHPGKDAEISDTLDSFQDAGLIINENDVVVDIDSLSKDQISKLIKKNGWITETVWTNRGAHLYFNKPPGFKRATGVTAFGFPAEYKRSSNCKAITVKQNGVARPIDNAGKRMELPASLMPGKYEDLVGLSKADGRNNKLFSHRCKIDKLRNFKSVISSINEIIFADPLPQDEVDTICRDMDLTAEKDGESLIADAIMSERRVVKYAEELYFYDRHSYVTDDNRLRRIIYEYCPGQKTRYIDEVFKQLDYRSPLIETTKMFKIKLKNGILYDGKFVKIDYKEFTPYYIPIEYDENAEPVPIVDRYLDQLTNSDKDYEMRLVEAIAHCLITDKEFKRLLAKFFIFVGDGGNGKGTFLCVIRAILGHTNCGALSIKNMSDERYFNTLHGKLANLGDDIQDEPINNEQMKMLKNISTCDLVEIRKLYHNSVNVELSPTLIFTSNHVLKSFEKGEAYKRRVDWMPMYTKPKKKEPDFISKLTSEKALRYWMQIVVEGYKRLYQNKEFTHSDIVTDYNKRYHEENDSTIMFVRDLEPDDIEFRRSPEVYEEYEVWAKEMGETVLSARALKVTIREIMGFEIRQKKMNGKNTKVFQKIKSEFDGADLINF